MELNREQIIKALDWLDSLVGNSNDSDIALFTYQLLGILYDTCEELTEKYEDLQRQFRDLDIECCRLEKRDDELTEENERLRANNLTFAHGVEKVAANYYNLGCTDTVRKMQNELKKTFSALCKGEMSDLFRIIDQIAEEMIGETNG